MFHSEVYWFWKRFIVFWRYKICCFPVFWLCDVECDTEKKSLIWWVCLLLKSCVCALTLVWRWYKHRSYQYRARVTGTTIEGTRRECSLEVVSETASMLLLFYFELSLLNTPRNGSEPHTNYSINEVIQFIWLFFKDWKSHFSNTTKPGATVSKPM